MKRLIEQRVPLVRQDIAACQTVRSCLGHSWAGATHSSYDDGCPETRSAALHDAWQKQLPCPILVVDGTAPLAENAARMEELLCSAN